MRTPRPLRLLLVLPLLLLAACTAGQDDEGDDAPHRWPELAPGNAGSPRPAPTGSGSSPESSTRR